MKNAVRACTTALVVASVATLGAETARASGSVESGADVAAAGASESSGWRAWLDEFLPTARTRPDVLTDDHNVDVFDLVDLEDLLAPGEARPEPVFEELYVVARAPARMAGICDDVVATIGSICDVSRPEVTLRKDGRYQIGARLLFRPSFDVGQRELTPGHAWIPARFDFGPGRQGDEEVVTSASEARRAALMRVEAACAEVVARFGTCVPMGIDLTPVSVPLVSAQQGVPPMGARGQIKVYMPGTAESDTELRAFVASLEADVPSIDEAAASPVGPAVLRHVMFDIARRAAGIEALPMVAARPFAELPGRVVRGIN